MIISNDGPTILHTDYWESEHAARGLLWLSVNAGVLRLLVPPSAPPILDETARATHASAQVSDILRAGFAHLVFEDGSPEPYAVTLDARQCDRSLPSTEVGRWVPLALYTEREGATVHLRSIPALIARAHANPNLRKIPTPVKPL